MTSLIPIRITFDLNRDDLKSVLCWTQRDVSVDEQMPNWSKAEINRQVREALAYAGRERFYYWSDDLPDDDDREVLAERIESWAKACVDKAWPR